MKPHPRLHGSPARILRTLRELADDDGSIQISQLDLAITSGYTVNTVQFATRLLEHCGLLHRSIAPGRHATRYHLP